MLAGDDEVGQLASRFNDAAERIENLLAAHKSLLANASHELRSPLARIRMGLDLPPTPALQTEIARSVEELNQLIDEILLASRLEASQADLGTLIQVDLTGLVAEECAHTGAVFEPLSIDPVMVPGVLKLVRRVVRNVLENARRYSDGKVNVTLAQSDGFAVLCVADAGPGVPEGLRTRIFEPFYRLPGASEQSGGVGLGLSLVKSITERMAGTVHCESPAKGVGAVFVVRLPTV
jgi:signal transduction histidine kinase